MLSMGLVLTLIDIAITGYLLDLVMKVIINVRPKKLRVGFYRLFNNGVTAFLLNLSISNMLAYFTGQGLIAGMANLGSSVLVALFLPMYLKQRYYHRLYI